MNAVPEWLQARNRRLAARLQRRMPEALHAREFLREGVLKRVVGLTIEAVGCEMPLGANAHIETHDGEWVDAEVVGFAGDRTFLMPSTEVQGLLPNARVVPKSGEGLVAVGDALLGRVIDGEGVPLDGRGELGLDAATKLLGTPINPCSASRSINRWMWAYARSTR